MTPATLLLILCQLKLLEMSGDTNFIGCIEVVGRTVVTLQPDVATGWDSKERRAVWRVPLSPGIPIDSAQLRPQGGWIVVSAVREGEGKPALSLVQISDAGVNRSSTTIRWARVESVADRSCTVLSKDGAMLTSFDCDGKLVLFNTTLQTRRLLPDSVRDSSSLVFSEDGKSLASAGNGVLRIINTTSLGVEHTTYDAGAVRWIANDLSHAIIENPLGRVVRVDIKSNKREDLFVAGDGIAFNSKGELAALVTGGELQIWKVPTKELIAKERLPESHTSWQLAIGEMGDIVVAGSFIHSHRPPWKVGTLKIGSIARPMR